MLQWRAPFLTCALLGITWFGCGPQPTPLGEAQGAARADGPGLFVSGSLIYRLGNDAVIKGTVTDLPFGLEADYQVLVQGQVAAATVTAPGEFEWIISIPLGGLADPYFPYASFYSSDNRVAMPLLVELVKRPEGLVVARRKQRLYDLRQDPDLELAESDGHVEALAAQLTTRGLDRLERTHLSTLPPPDLATFNALLSDSYTEPVQEVDLPTSILRSDRTCFPLNEVEQLFANTSAVVAARTLATAQQVAYSAAASSGAGALLLAQFCVTASDNVKANSNYEVCVGRLRGTLDHADVLAANYVDLAVGNDVDSKVVLGNIDQIVDIEFTDVTVRWAKRPFCTMRVALTTQVSDEVLAATPERAAWARCEDTNARALEASSGSWPSDIVPGRSPERILLESSATTYEVLPNDQVITALSNHCAAPEFKPKATELLELYFPILEQALGTAWSVAVPDNAYADALDGLFRPFEHGTYDVGLDHDLQSNFSARGALPGVDGLAFRYNANAEVRSDFEIIPAPTSFVCPDSISPILSPDGLSEHVIRVPFDVLFSTTTCALNQVLREEHATDRVNLTLPEGAGAALSAAFASVDAAALGALTATTVQWRMSPTLPAWTWMSPHALPGDSVYLVPIAYHHYDLKLEAFDGADRLLSLRLDFLDTDFRLNLDHTLGATVAVPKLGEKNFAVTVAASELPDCPMAPHDESGSTSCERQLEELAGLILQPGMEILMRDLLSHYPVPMFFDAAGLTADPVQTLGISPIQRNNRITWYALLPASGMLPAPP